MAHSPGRFARTAGGAAKRIHKARVDTTHRTLHLEPLEDRRLLAVDSGPRLLANSASGETPIVSSTPAFTAAPVVVSIPDFARGPGQAVNLPASSATGIPLSISNAAGVTKI